MKLYIDKENLLSLLNQGEKEIVSELYEEVIRLIKRHLDLIFNFDKKECLNNPLLLKWMNQLSQGRGDTSSADEFKRPPFPERPIKNNFRTNLPWNVFYSAFLVDDEKVDALKQQNSMLIGKVGEETSVLSSLFCNSSFDLHSLYNIQDKTTFDGWETLKKDGHIMPCSDIVIADRYLFSDISRLESNLYKILSLFAKGVQKPKINIVFFSDSNDEVLRKSVCKRINEIFGKETKVKVTFVVYGNNRPHDRFILTNYRLFRSGDSFNYYDKSGYMVSKGLSLDVDSLANINACSLVSQIQKDMQDLCNNATDRIFGAKESNFIRF